MYPIPLDSVDLFSGNLAGETSTSLTAFVLQCGKFPLLIGDIKHSAQVLFISLFEFPLDVLIYEGPFAAT